MYYDAKGTVRHGTSTETKVEGSPLDEITIEFNPSAFKHGIGEEDIRTAIERFVYNEVMEDDSEKHLLLGFDTHANLLEIIYNMIDRQTINVFHAMKCRKAYYSLAEKYIRRLLWQE